MHCNFVHKSSFVPGCEYFCTVDDGRKVVWFLLHTPVFVSDFPRKTPSESIVTFYQFRKILVRMFTVWSFGWYLWNVVALILRYSHDFWKLLETYILLSPFLYNFRWIIYISPIKLLLFELRQYLIQFKGWRFLRLKN